MMSLRAVSRLSVRGGVAVSSGSSRQHSVLLARASRGGAARHVPLCRERRGLSEALKPDPTKPVGPLGAPGPASTGEAGEPDAYWWVPYAVMSAIGGLVFWFYRASAAHTNRTEQLDAIDEERALAEGEKEELRDKNASFLTADQFAAVCNDAKRVLRAQGCADRVSYVNFADACNRFLDRPLDSAHLLDRVAMFANAAEQNDTDQLELGFLFGVL